MFSINQIVNPSFLSGWVLIDLIGLIDFDLISLVFLSHTSEATRASTVLWGSINKYGNSVLMCMHMLESVIEKAR